MLTVSYALFLSVKRTSDVDRKKPPSLCHQSGGFKSTELFCSRPSAASHIDQQQRAVDQGTLASPSQVAAPQKGALLMHGEEPRVAAIGEQGEIVS